MQPSMRQACLVAVVAGVFAGLAGAPLAQSNSEVGTWKLNVTKSKYSPGPMPLGGTTKIEAAGAGVKVTVDQTFPGRPARHYEYTANYDGKDSAVTGNNPDADTVARTRVDANTVMTVNKKGGKVTTSNRSVISGDGKTRTVTTTGTNAQGQTVNNVAIFEKQ